MTATQTAPPTAVIAAVAAVALVCVAWRPAWRRTRHLVTITHEGAHGVAALLCGRRLAGIRLHSDTSGLTLSRGRARGPGMIVTAAAGYPGPALIGLAAAYLLRVGHAIALLWAVLALLALLVVQIRNWFGLWSILVAAGLVFAVSWWAPAQWQSAFAYAGTFFLLFAAPRPVLEMQRARRQGHRSSDADILARLTPLPAAFWVLLLILGTVAALGVGSYWMLAGR